MNVAEHVADATLSSSAANTSIQAKARVILSGDYLADASLDTQGIPLQPLLVAYAPVKLLVGRLNSMRLFMVLSKIGTCLRLM